MRKPTLLQACVPAAAVLFVWAPRAQAVQLAISEPSDIEMFEANGRAVTESFQVINTGVPTLKSIEFVSIEQVVAPNSSIGDFDREVLSKFLTGDCKSGDLTVTRLAPTESCTIVSTFLALDGDPFDRHKIVDSATWIAGISIKWRFVGQTETHKDVEGGLVKIKDDPIPEPSTWATLLTGFAVLGAAARRARGRFDPRLR